MQAVIVDMGYEGGKVGEGASQVPDLLAPEMVGDQPCRSPQ